MARLSRAVGMSGTGLPTRGLGLDESLGAGGTEPMGLETHATTESPATIPALLFRGDEHCHGLRAAGDVELGEDVG